MDSLIRMSSFKQAGAHMVAPSDMMDGRSKSTSLDHPKVKVLTASDPISQSY